jgi:hypothetical protein
VQVWLTFWGGVVSRVSYQGDAELGRASLGWGVVNARNPFYDDWYARFFEGFPLGGCK